jgi:hypothetical protein
MARTHQPGQEVFRSILSEDIDWKSRSRRFRRRRAGACWRAYPARTLHDQGKGALRRETHAAQTP